MGRVRRCFSVRLGLIAVLALALRAVYLLVLAPAPVRVVDDTFWYAFVSDEIVLGHGFTIGSGPLFSSGFHLEPTALHPPLYPLALAGLRELGVMSPKGLLWLGPVTGTMTVVGLGLVGRALAGPGTGLTAAALAAVYPLLIVADGALLSETLYGPAIVLVLASALALARRPGVRWAAGLGLAVGLASLVRAEAIGLVVLLALPLAWRGPGGATRVLRLAVTVACTLVVIAPWVVRNEEALGTATLSTNDGVTLAGSNCGLTYYGAELGSLDYNCPSSHLSGNEAQRDAELRSHALHYALDHAGRLPIVIAARLARTWGLFDPIQGRANNEGRNVTVSNIGVVFYYFIAALALVGAWALRRRRSELWVLLAPLVLVSLTAAVTFGGDLRLRYLAEPALVLLAALGVGAMRERRNARRLGRQPLVRTSG